MHCWECIKWFKDKVCIKSILYTLWNLYFDFWHNCIVQYLSARVPKLFSNHVSFHPRFAREKHLSHDLTEKREKRVILHLRMGTTGKGGGGHWKIFWRLNFYAFQHTKIWNNSKRSSHTIYWKVKILLIIHI